MKFAVPGSIGFRISRDFDNRFGLSSKDFPRLSITNGLAIQCLCDFGVLLSAAIDRFDFAYRKNRQAKPGLFVPSEKFQNLALYLLVPAYL